MARNVTFLEFLNAVSQHARWDREVIATVAYMVNRGAVRLCGALHGARIDLAPIAD